MATVKEVLDSFCYRVNIPISASYVGATSPAENQYLSLLKFIGDDLRNRPFLWPQLKRSYTATLTPSVATIQLPGDLYRPLESTQWDLTNKWPLRGPISDYNMSMRSFSMVSLQTRKAYRILGAQNYIYATSPYTQRSAGTMQLDPVPTDADQVYMEYIGRNWVWPRDWVTGTVYAGGDIRTGVNQIYRTAAGGTSGATRPSHTTGSATDGTVSWTVYTEPYIWTHDSDILLFDDDLLIEGMVWAYLRSKGQDYEAVRSDYEQAVRNACARFNGLTRINMADELGACADDPNIPAGSWSV